MIYCILCIFASVLAPQVQLRLVPLDCREDTSLQRATANNSEQRIKVKLVFMGKKRKKRVGSRLRKRTYDLESACVLHQRPHTHIRRTHTFILTASRKHMTGREKATRSCRTQILFVIDQLDYWQEPVSHQTLNRVGSSTVCVCVSQR